MRVNCGLFMEQENKKRTKNLKVEVDEHFLSEVTRLCDLQMSLEGISACLGISANWFLKLRKDYPSIKEAMRKGYSQREQKLVKSLSLKADQGNLDATKYILERRYGWNMSKDTRYKKKVDKKPEFNLNITGNAPGLDKDGCPLAADVD